MKLTNKRILGGLIALLFVVSIAQSHAIVKIAKNIKGDSKANQSAQVFGSVSLAYPHQNVYGPEDNKQSFTFTSNRVASIKACAAGGGGAGGSRGYEDGSNNGSGGAGGGGGGRGECRTLSRVKFRSGDVVTWNIGYGGSGGQYGIINVDFDGPQTLDDTSPTAGMNGGSTQVFVNSTPLFAPLIGGNGGHPGTNASSGGPGWAGEAFGGSSDNTTAHASWHMGGYGSGSSGGAGGQGETSSSYAGGLGGAGGTAVSGNQFGWNGNDGYPSFGGGGGGGGGGLWYDYNHNNGIGGLDDAIMNHGGWGGTGGDGYVIIYW